MNTHEWYKFHDTLFFDVSKELNREHPRENALINSVSQRCRLFMRRINDWLSSNYEIKLYKAVLYVNSIFTDEKRIATYYPNDDAWSELDRAFTLFNFELDVKVHHILPESIWRLRDKNEVICPAICWENGLEFEYPYKISIGDTTLDPSVINAATEECQKRLREGKDSEVNCNSLWQILFKSQNVKSVVKKAREDLSEYLPRKESYSEEEGYKLLSHIIWHVNHNPVHKNIFYIPDLLPSSASGGMVCILDLTNFDNQSIKLVEIIQELQRILSHFCISPIRIAEYDACAVFVRPSGHYFRYRNKYFSSEDVFESFEEEITKVTEDGGDNETTKIVLGITEELFEELTAPKLATLIKGYKRISQRIFIYVCRLWNVLKLEDNFKPFSEIELLKLKRDVLRFPEIEKERLDSKKGEESRISLRLIYEALNFEESLKEVPSYRDHFIHSFHVFCLGLWIASQKFVPEQIKQIRQNELLLKQWFYASFWHDIGYSVEKIEQLANAYIKKMVFDKGNKTTIPITPHWGHFSLVDYFYDFFAQACVSKKISEITKKTDSEVVKDIFRIMLETADHGILSGLLLYHHFNVNNEDYKKVLDAILATIFHQCGGEAWEKSALLKDVCLSYDQAIPHLLKLSDTLSQFSREFDEGEKNEILLNYIKSEPQHARIRYLYPSDMDRGKLIDNMLKHYKEPFKCLSKHPGTHGNAVDVCLSNGSECTEEVELVYPEP